MQSAALAQRHSSRVSAAISGDACICAGRTEYTNSRTVSVGAGNRATVFCNSQICYFQTCTKTVPVSQYPTQSFCRRLWCSGCADQRRVSRSSGLLVQGPQSRVTGPEVQGTQPRVTGPEVQGPQSRVTGPEVQGPQLGTGSPGASA